MGWFLFPEVVWKFCLLHTVQIGPGTYPPFFSEDTVAKAARARSQPLTFICVVQHVHCAIFFYGIVLGATQVQNYHFLKPLLLMSKWS